MTLLHQAAQKAVEALKKNRPHVEGASTRSYDGVGGYKTRADAKGCMEATEAAIAALESALQQQPEPVAKPSRVGEDGWRRLAESQAALLALQEVPREPVAERWHELKTDPDVFDAVADGRKTFEIRLNDRDFRVGDGLLLRRTRDTGWTMKNTGAPLAYTGEELRRVVSHVLHGPEYGLADGWAILSFAASPSTTQQQEAGSGTSAEIAMERRHIVAQLQLLAAIVCAPGGYSRENGYPATFAALSRQGFIEPTDSGRRYVATEAGRAFLAASPSTPEAREEALRLSGAAGLDPDPDVVAKEEPRG